MDQWTAFASLFALIEPFVRGSVDVIIRALTGYVEPALRWGLIAYIAGRMLWRAISPSGSPLSELEELLLKGSIALYLAANAAAYTGYVRDLLLYGLPREINAVIVGATGEAPISAAVFDDVWNRAWAAGSAVLKNLSWSDFTLSLIVFAYFVIAMIAILVAFVVWLKAFMFLSLLVAIGPLFIGLFVFPMLRSLTRNWLASVLTNIILQILAVALLSILVTAEKQIIAQIAGLYRSNGSVVAQTQLLLGMMMVFLVCGLLSVMLPGLANALGGGFGAADSGVLTGLVAGRFSNQPPPQDDNDPEKPPPQRDQRFLSQPAANSPPGRSLSNRRRVP